MSRARLALVVTFLAACGAPAPPGPASGGASRPHASAVTEPVAAFSGALATAPEATTSPLAEEPADVGQAEPPAAAEPAGWAPKNPVVAREETRGFVVVYHSFGLVPGRARSVMPSELEKQIRLLRESGVEIIPLSRLAEWYDGQRLLPRKVAVITMDDAEKAQYTLAWPILQREKVPFTLAIPTFGMVLPWAHAGRFDWSELRVMRDSGLCDVASHSHTHSNLKGLSPRQLETEVVRSRNILEAHIGPPVDVFVHPFGAYDGGVTRSLERAGYRLGFGIVGATVTHRSPRWELGRWEVNGQTTLERFRGYLKSAKMLD